MYDSSGMEREPFNGRGVPLPTRSRRRYAHRGHGPRCSARDYEIGCVCGAESDERDAPCARCGCVRARMCETPDCPCGHGKAER